VIAAGSALFGIWSAKDVEYLKAGVASGLTVAGIVISLVAAWDDRNSSLGSGRLADDRPRQIVADLQKRRGGFEKQRLTAIGRERSTLAQFRALQTSLQLNNLEIVWTIPNAPESLKDAIYLADSIFDSYAISDDEFSRMLSINELGEVRGSFAVDNAVGPIL